jgi:hypothetical protein
VSFGESAATIQVRLLEAKTSDNGETLLRDESR